MGSDQHRAQPHTACDQANEPTSSFDVEADQLRETNALASPRAELASAHDRGRSATKPPIADETVTNAIKKTEDYRAKLFTFALWLVGLSFLATTAALAYILIALKEANPAVVAAYFTGVTVQIVGILLIVARSVFPTNHTETLYTAKGLTEKRSTRESSKM